MSVIDLLRKRESVEAVRSSIVDFWRGLLLVILDGLVRRRMKSGRLFHAEGGIGVRGFEEAMSYGLSPRRSATLPKSLMSARGVSRVFELLLDPLLSLLGQSNHDLGLENDLPLERDLDCTLRPRSSSSSGVGDGNLISFTTGTKDRTEAFVLGTV